MAATRAALKKRTAQILRLRAGGASVRAIALAFGHTERQIYRILAAAARKPA